MLKTKCMEGQPEMAEFEFLNKESVTGVTGNQRKKQTIISENMEGASIIVDVTSTVSTDEHKGTMQCAVDEFPDKQLLKDASREAVEVNPEVQKSCEIGSGSGPEVDKCKIGSECIADEEMVSGAGGEEAVGGSGIMEDVQGINEHKQNDVPVSSYEDTEKSSENVRAENLTDSGNLITDKPSDTLTINNPGEQMKEPGACPNEMHRNSRCEAKLKEEHCEGNETSDVPVETDSIGPVEESLAFTPTDDSAMIRESSNRDTVEIEDNVFVSKDISAKVSKDAPTLKIMLSRCNSEGGIILKNKISSDNENDMVKRKVGRPKKIKPENIATSSDNSNKANLVEIVNYVERHHHGVGRAGVSGNDSESVQGAKQEKRKVGRPEKIRVFESTIRGNMNKGKLRISKSLKTENSVGKKFGTRPSTINANDSRQDKEKKVGRPKKCPETSMTRSGVSSLANRNGSLKYRNKMLYTSLVQKCIKAVKNKGKAKEWKANLKKPLGTSGTCAKNIKKLKTKESTKKRKVLNEKSKICSETKVSDSLTKRGGFRNIDMGQICALESAQKAKQDITMVTEKDMKKRHCRRSVGGERKLRLIDKSKICESSSNSIKLHQKKYCEKAKIKKKEKPVPESPPLNSTPPIIELDRDEADFAVESMFEDDADTIKLEPSSAPPKKRRQVKFLSKMVPVIEPRASMSSLCGKVFEKSKCDKTHKCCMKAAAKKSDQATQWEDPTNSTLDLSYIMPSVNYGQITVNQNFPDLPVQQMDTTKGVLNYPQANPSTQNAQQTFSYLRACLNGNLRGQLCGKLTQIPMQKTSSLSLNENVTLPVSQSILSSQHQGTSSMVHENLSLAVHQIIPPTVYQNLPANNQNNQDSSPADKYTMVNTPTGQILIRPPVNENLSTPSQVQDTVGRKECTSSTAQKKGNPSKDKSSHSPSNQIRMMTSTYPSTGTSTLCVNQNMPNTPGDQNSVLHYRIPGQGVLSVPVTVSTGMEVSSDSVSNGISYEVPSDTSGSHRKESHWKKKPEKVSWATQAKIESCSPNRWNPPQPTANTHYTYPSQQSHDNVRPILLTYVNSAGGHTTAPLDLGSGNEGDWSPETASDDVILWEDSPQHDPPSLDCDYIEID